MKFMNYLRPFQGDFILLFNLPEILQFRVNYICKMFVAFGVQADGGKLLPREIVSSQFYNIPSKQGPLHSDHFSGLSFC